MARGKAEPLVSVIMPAYNSAAYINQAIDSVLAQTYSQYEIIVADDGSTDSTTTIVKRYGNKVHLIECPHAGISATRNTAIKASHGQYVAFLDSDDMWEPNKLELQIPWLEAHPGTGLLYSYHTNFYADDSGKVVSTSLRHPDLEGRGLFPKIMRYGSFGLSTIVIPRPVLDDVGLFDDTFEAAEDRDLVLRIALKYPIYRLSVSLLQRRIHVNSFFASKYDSQFQYELPNMERFLSNPVYEQALGDSKAHFISQFVARMLYKFMYDGRLDLARARVRTLRQYSWPMYLMAGVLVACHVKAAWAWKPLIPDDFDSWQALVEHKSNMHEANLHGKGTS